MFLSVTERRWRSSFGAIRQKRNPGQTPLKTVSTSSMRPVFFLDGIKRFGLTFDGSGLIVELGGGQGWASCIVKRMYPHAKVVLTDISHYALASLPKWERILGAKLDGIVACRSYELPAADSSVDCVFCFASAHHFGAHGRTIREIARVLKPGGRCLYLYEPSCPPWIHRIARWRVRRKRSWW